MGRKKINLDIEKIAAEYLAGQELIQLGEKYSVSQWTLLARFKEFGIRKTTRRHLNQESFGNFTTKSCYWAGFLAADGHVKKYHLGCELAIKDRQHLEKLRSFLCSNANIKERTRESFGKFHTYCLVQFNSVKLVQDLETNFNITRNKSLSYRPPKLPRNMTKHFIRGYIDGDGSIGWHNHSKTLRLNICSGSRELLQWIFEHFHENIDGVGNPAVKKRKNAKLYTIEFMGHQTKNILNWLYKDSEIHLDRKYQKFLELKTK